VTPKEVELLSELTIVIPTANRSIAMRREIAYWQDKPVNVHILDGSSKQSYPVGVISGAKNITYHYFEPNVDQLPYANFRRRIRFAVSLKKTMYCALLGDEDFFTMSGLLASLKVLSESSTVCSITGATAGFEVDNGVAMWGMRNFNKQPIEEYGSLNLGSRLKPQIVGHLPVIYYGVFKTAAWDKTFELSFGHREETELLGGKRIVNMCALAIGPMKVIENLLWLRQYTKDVESYAAFDGSRGGYDRYLADPRNQAEVCEYFEALAGAIKAGNPELSSSKCLKLAKKSLVPGFRSSQSGIKFSTRRRLAKLVTRIGSLLPGRIRIALNRSVGKNFSRSLGFIDKDGKYERLIERQSLDSLLSKLSDTRIIFDASEIRSVENLILSN
jgi:glycosyltransferase domain-containing protein